jgi:hypothetical protein
LSDPKSGRSERALHVAVGIEAGFDAEDAKRPGVQRLRPGNAIGIAGSLDRLRPDSALM